MSGNSRVRDRFNSTLKLDRGSVPRVNEGREHLRESAFEMLRWPDVGDQPDHPSECSAQLAVNLMQGKWKTRILSRLQQGPARLGELCRLLPQASKKMLAQHLREMERDGLVVRKDLSGRVLHVEYSLSESGGYAALCLISMLQNWSNEHLPFKTNE